MHTPRFPSNIFSIHYLCVNNDVSVEFIANYVFVKKSKSKNIGSRSSEWKTLHDQRWHAPTLSLWYKFYHSLPNVYSSSINNGVWHTRLAHPSNKFFDWLVNHYLHQNVSTKRKGFCVVCPLAKDKNYLFLNMY